MSERERRAEGKQSMEETDTRGKMVCRVNKESPILEKGRVRWKERKRAEKDKKRMQMQLTTSGHSIGKPHYPATGTLHTRVLS